VCGETIPEQSERLGQHMVRRDGKAQLGGAIREPGVDDQQPGGRTHDVRGQQDETGLIAGRGEEVIFSGQEAGETRRVTAPATHEVPTSQKRLDSQ
jgi:hypothetical protein